MRHSLASNRRRSIRVSYIFLNASIAKYELLNFLMDRKNAKIVYELKFYQIDNVKTRNVPAFPSLSKNAKDHRSIATV